MRPSRTQDRLTRRGALLAGSAASFAAAAQTSAKPSDRDEWLAVMRRVATPVLENMAARRLKATMPVQSAPGVTDRPEYTYLEALGRTLCGIAPWLEGEGSNDRLCGHAREAIDAATDPASPDYCNFERGAQPLVDAAFLAHAIVRAPEQLWRKLPAKVQDNVATALAKTRVITPGWSNWLLFAAMVEAGLKVAGRSWQKRPVQTAVDIHMTWYKGDGWYGDGPDLHWDYYNSFVIQPMLVDVLRVFAPDQPSWQTLYPKVLARARRYAAIQERLISPEGTFPAIGRSLAYRIGAFQALGQMALMHQLPDGVKPAQVRSALTAILKRQMHQRGTFDANGWLRIGFAGDQPSIGERYISTGSCYLCCAGFLPLGLPASDEFWSAPPMDWTAKRAWAGEDLPADHAL
jgi:hypothetical protein